MPETSPGRSKRSRWTPWEIVGRADSLGLLEALTRSTVRRPDADSVKVATDLVSELARITIGRSSVAPPAKDWRFTNRTWSEHPVYRRLGQSYLAWSDSVRALVETADLDWRDAQRAMLAANLLTSAVAPTNFLPTNPEALERAWETAGKSLLRGLGHFVSDVRQNRGIPRSVDPEAFEVGRDLATTPGTVVHRSELFELIQYTPTTASVYARPLVLVPPQINKYYVMDLAPQRSFIEYAVAQGFQMFAMSWRNAKPDHAAWGLADYVEATEEAIEVARTISGSPDVNTVSVCAGGLTTAALLGELAARGDEMVHSATFMVTLLDFEIPTMIGMFASEQSADRIAEESRRTGVIAGHDLRLLFSMLRPNDLMFNYWVGSNLLGDDLPAYDVLAWNADSTCLPAGLHADFLDILVHNTLARGELELHGRTIDLSAVGCDNFVVGAQTDHLTAWRATYATTQLLGGPSEFVLSSSGHIQCLVNGPNAKKMTATTGPEPGPDPDTWLTQATTVDTSWWERWSVWQAVRAGDRIPAPATAGCDCHPAIEPAPGTYVLER
jgi:polyhydroxyalkanoate synthase